MAHNPPERAFLKARYFSSRCTCSTKRWPGFGSAVIDAQYTADQVKYWLGIDDETYIEWIEHGAPIAVHIALRARTDLGYLDSRFNGWRLRDGWLIAPNGRKLSLKRLCNILDYAYRDARN